MSRAVLRASVLALALMMSQSFACIIVLDEGEQAHMVEEREEGGQGFEHIQISGDVEVRVRICDCSSVRVEGAAPERVTTSTSGGRLYVRGDAEDEAIVYVRTPSLSRLQLSGQARAVVSGLSGGKLTLSSSGAAYVSLEGSVSMLDSLSSGDLYVDAFSLRAYEAKVVSSGAATMRLCVTDELRIISSGQTDIIYDCDPLRVDEVASGDANIRPRVR